MLKDRNRRPGLLRGIAFGALFGSAGLVYSGEAAAFCRQTTCDEEDCPTDTEECVADGEPLYYATTCLNFAVASGVAQHLALSDRQFEALVEEAYARWMNVDCGGGRHPSFTVQSAGVVEAQGKFFCKKEPEVNVSVWTFQSEWDDRRMGKSALGYTTSTFSTETGQIFDADVEINLARVVEGFSPVVFEEVVRAIATHEAGHTLGIGHTLDSEAIMTAQYSNATLLGRDFRQDDIDAICSIFPPEEDESRCSTPGVTEAALGEEACAELAAERQQTSLGSTCSLTASTSRSRPVALLAYGLTLGLLWRRRTRA